jgi:DNA-binding NtrC family response regulator
MTTRVLLVDDESYILSALARTLRDESMHVEVTTDPYRALDMIDTARFDAVVSDERMPGLSGCDLLHTIAQAHPAVVRVMLTGTHPQEVASRAVNRGFVDCLFFKPVSGEDIAKGIKSALRMRRLLVAANKVLDLARRQRRYLDAIEREYPGIRHIDRDEQGMIVLDCEDGIEELEKRLSDFEGDPDLAGGESKGKAGGRAKS